jgi:GNAT superfamily N-acetyltransferase
MGVTEDYQSKGIGKKLLKTAEINLKKKGIIFILVKTLSNKKRNKFYANTRKFYTHNNFYPIHETTKIWGQENPCLILAKII